MPAISSREHVIGTGRNFFDAAREQGIEGITAKAGDSHYSPGKRSSQWLKMRTDKRQEAVIGGFTEPRAGHRHLGAVVLGVYDDGGKLVNVGHAAPEAMRLGGRSSGSACASWSRPRVPSRTRQSPTLPYTG